MKLIDRITYVTFGINIAAILFYFIGLPIIVMTIPDAFDKITANKGQNSYNIALTVISTVVFFHWLYCIWFLFKYDRHSKSIFPLLFFNVIYAPIYFYRVRIKKRPLRKKINKPKQDIETEDMSTTADEFEDLTRNNVFGVIDLWASEKSQLDYQKDVPIAQVSAELFCQWDDFYYPDSSDFKQAFSKVELEILAEFDKALNETVDKTPENPPQIDVFIKTQEWIDMNKKAIEIKNKLNKVGNKRL
ncbi:MAG: hypothetical protein JW783_01420 [Bacteroidales bacterium]|nr:hypothetical protein [Bacteroidales bacterium]